MRFYKIYILCFIAYTALLAITGCTVILAGYSMGAYSNLPYIVLVVTKIILYPIGLVDSIIPDSLSERDRNIIAISMAILFVSYFCALSIAGVRSFIRRFWKKYFAD